MPKNIEIKARVHDMRRMEALLAATAITDPEVLVQRDTFYRCQRGRLKLRECEGRVAELILYVRADTKCPKVSDYLRLAVPDADHADRLLADSHGVIGVVSKTRRVYLLDGVRIHLDEVTGLGEFLELEVLVDRWNEMAAVGVARDLMAQLGVREEDLIASAYIDLLHVP